MESRRVRRTSGRARLSFNVLAFSRLAFRSLRHAPNPLFALLHTLCALSSEYATGWRCESELVGACATDSSGGFAFTSSRVPVPVRLTKPKRVGFRLRLIAVIAKRYDERVLSSHEPS